MDRWRDGGIVSAGGRRIFTIREEPLEGLRDYNHRRLTAAGIRGGPLERWKHISRPRGTARWMEGFDHPSGTGRGREGFSPSLRDRHPRGTAPGTEGFPPSARNRLRDGRISTTREGQLERWSDCYHLRWTAGRIPKVCKPVFPRSAAESLPVHCCMSLTFWRLSPRSNFAVLVLSKFTKIRKIVIAKANFAENR